MSDYWVSKKKYFCKYCDIYIADDAPSRQQHENGLRHKGNVERFIRGIYKTGEKQRKDAEEERQEMRRVEQAAQAAFASDVGAGYAKPTNTSVASTSKTSQKPAPKPSNPFANYSTAESLGYTDPDAERIAAEAERRRSQGVAGEWQIVTPPTPSSGSTEALVEANLKRDAQPLDDDDVRAFKIQKKSIRTGLGAIYDPGVIPIMLRKKEPEEGNVLPSEETKAPVKEESLPKWTAIPLKKEDGPTQDPSGSSSAASAKWAKAEWGVPLPDIKPEERAIIFGPPTDNLSSADQSPPSNSNIKPEPEDTKPDLIPEINPPAGLFKKRKAPMNAGRSRRPV